MNGSQIGVLFASLCADGSGQCAIDVSRRRDALRPICRAGATAISSGEMEISTGDRVMSSPVFKDNVIYFGGDDGNVYAVDAETGRQIWKRATNGPVPATPAIVDGTLYIGSYDGKFYALDARTGALKWKVTTEGERRFEAKGLHGLQPKNQTIADPFDVFLRVPWLRMAASTSEAATEIFMRWIQRPAICVGNSKPATSFTRRRRSRMASYFSEAGTAIFTRWTRRPVRRNGVFTQVKTPHSQSGGVPIFAGGRKRCGLHRLPGRELVCARCGDRQREVAFQHRIELGDYVAGGCRWHRYSSRHRTRVYITSSMQTVGSPWSASRGKPTCFPRQPLLAMLPSLACLNGTLEARDVKTGELLWDYQVETSKQNKGWVLTADRKFNVPFLYHSNWREAPIVANDQQIRIGGIFSSPLVVEWRGLLRQRRRIPLRVGINSAVSLVEWRSSGNLLT